jgi:pyruvate kinase
MLQRLVDEGMDLARFKFTHGKRQHHAEVLSTLRSICKAKGRSVATLMDLQASLSLPI